MWPFNQDKKFHSNKRSSQKRSVQKAGSLVKKSSYAAVKIEVAKDSACQQARDMAGQVFLCNQAPLTPLPQCPRKSSCKCRYIHLKDRRIALRRDSDIGFPQVYRRDERRVVMDRRQS